MILIDVSLLICAHNTADPRFLQASSWFEGLMNKGRPAFCWETVNGFIRVSTNRSAMPNPYTMREAFAVVEDWLELPNVSFLIPGGDHLKVLQSVSVGANAAGSLYSDSILAAYAISHNATLASSDRDFRLFEGLKLINPLVE
ncbi:MAG: PIN domain-containing protein [Acidobacteria bacterium]|nr:PIN domain-containing protein [Acidobacteriota bacterium]